jgi:hypothetical protein
MTRVNSFTVSFSIRYQCTTFFMKDIREAFYVCKYIHIYEIEAAEIRLLRVI